MDKHGLEFTDILSELYIYIGHSNPVSLFILFLFWHYKIRSDIE